MQPGLGETLPSEEACGVIEVSLALLLQSDRVFVTRRGPGAHLGGEWEFPGGKLEPDETAEQALRRELREEVGVEVEIEDRLSSIRYAYPDRVVLLHPFVCSPLASLSEGVDRWWVDRDALDDLSFPVANKPLLEWLSHHG